jgi:hypothetical protein
MLFFKGIFCDGNPGEPGGINFDGRAPDGTPHYGGAMPNVGQDMLGLFAEDGEYEVGGNEDGSVTDISLLKGDEEAKVVPLQLTNGMYVCDVSCLKQMFSNTYVPTILRFYSWGCEF